MFPDSKIAQSYSCGQMKTTAILKGVLAPESYSSLVTVMQNQVFSFMMDESTDRGDERVVS